jgi:hypothetical protein
MPSLRVAIYCSDATLSGDTYNQSIWKTSAPGYDWAKGSARPARARRLTGRQSGERYVLTRTQQRHTVAACFLSWTLDAFDFFIMVFVLADIAKEFSTTMAAVTIADHTDLGGAAARSAPFRLCGGSDRPPSRTDHQCSDLYGF